MQKNALPITLATLVVSIFGAFLRWLQTRNIFDENGLAIPGLGISAIYLIYSVLALGAIAALVLLWLRRYDAAKDAAAALADPTVFPFAIACVLGAAFVICALSAMFTSEQSEFPLMQRILGAFGIFAGLCIPFVPARRTGGHHTFSRTAIVFLTLFCCYWLVFAYRLNAENPVIWAYAPEMAALAVTTLAVFHVAAYFHDRAKPTRALICVQAAVFLDVSVIFDVRPLFFTAMLAVSALLLMMLEYLLLTNLKAAED